MAARLPLLHEMFACLIKPSCARELEAMCSCLSLAADVLPPAFAGGWQHLGWVSRRLTAAFCGSLCLMLLEASHHFSLSMPSLSRADKLADWAMDACRELSNLTYPGAARALLSLALRGRSAAAAPPPGPAPLGAAIPKREPGCGDDMDLLLDLAADVRQMLNIEGVAGACVTCALCMLQLTMALRGKDVALVRHALCPPS